MAGSGGKKGEKDAIPNIHMTKKCPECFVYLPLNAKVCHSCGQAVGPVNKLGLAEKPPNVLGYVVAGLAVLAFITFVWWGFLSDESDESTFFQNLLRTFTTSEKDEKDCSGYSELAIRIGICALEPLPADKPGNSFRAKVIDKHKAVWSSCKGTFNGDIYRFVNKGNGYWETDGGAPACPFYEGFYLGSKIAKDYQLSSRNTLASP